MNLMRGIDLKKIAEKMGGASGAELKVFLSSLFGTFLGVGIQTGFKLLGVSCARDAYVNTQQSCMSVYLKSTLQNLISYQHKDLASDVHLVYNPILV